jgi:hypothetical protein
VSNHGATSVIWACLDAVSLLSMPCRADDAWTCLYSLQLTLAQRGSRLSAKMGASVDETTAQGLFYSPSQLHALAIVPCQLQCAFQQVFYE